MSDLADIPFSDPDAPATTAEVYVWFDTLAPVAVDELIGDWRGVVLHTRHPIESAMADMRWDGKTFHSSEDVDPIVSLDESGDRFANPVMGKARLRRVEYRGALSAAMIYDKHAIIDYFRRLDADRLIGVMDRRGVEQPLFFALARLRRG